MTNGLYIEIPEEDYQKIGLRRASPDKVNEVLQLLIDPPDGKKQKQLHDVLEFKTHRCYDDGKIYLSRHGIAEAMDWGTATYASRMIKPLKASPLNKNKNLEIDINMYLLESEEGINGTKCWRVSNERLARSLITATEEHFFELSEEDEEEILELLNEMDLQRKGRRMSRLDLITEVNGEIYYKLLSSFYSKLRSIKRDRNTDEKHKELAEKYVERYKKYV